MSAAALFDRETLQALAIMRERNIYRDAVVELVHHLAELVAAAQVADVNERDLAVQLAADPAAELLQRLGVAS